MKTKELIEVIGILILLFVVLNWSSDVSIEVNKRQEIRRIQDSIDNNKHLKTKEKWPEKQR